MTYARALLKILMFNYEFPPIGGGGGWVTYFLGKHFVAAGHQVTVVTSQFEDLPATEVIEGMTIRRVPVWRKNRDVCAVYEMLTYVISSTYYGQSIAKIFQPDVVQVFFGIPSGACAYWLQRIQNLPYVVFLGGRDVPRPNPDPPYYRWLYLLLKPIIRSIWHKAEQVVACSDGLRQLALATDPEIAIDVIPDGLELDRFACPDKACPRAGSGATDAESVKILTIGRLIPRKGFQFLIQAIPQMVSRARNPFQIDIVGDGPYRAQLQKMVKDLKIEKYVHFSGSVDYADLPDKYRQADIFALCSSAEGMPLVVLEAMGAGLPIVASKVQGIEDLVAVGQNGALVEPGNIEQITDQLTNLINHPDQRRRMGETSVSRVQRYDWKNIAEAYLQIYQRITQS